MKYDQRKLQLKIIEVCTVFFFCWMFTSCKEEESDQPETVRKVLLVYMAGDNNLSEESHEKLKAIRQGWKATQECKILIYQDATDISPRLLQISDNNTLETIEEYSTENSADPDVFRRVIMQARTMYPDAKYNLLIFSHASGWLPDNTLMDTQSKSQNKMVLSDNGLGMKLTSFAAAIPHKAFEYIIFETCFMAGIEVAYELRDKACYISASSAEIVSPGFTAIYQKHISELAYGDPIQFMKEAFAYFDSQTGYMRSSTLSVIRTSNLESLAAYVRINCDFSKGVNINDVQHFDRNGHHLFADFEGYYSCLLKTKEQKEELQHLIDDCVVWKASTPYFIQDYNGFAITQYSGLTTYIMQEQYNRLNENYMELEWYKATR
ncbi:hypothetical protein JGH11_17120 [Dysgonomonas sp. Marseille-P4677]|uniref:clostripain-related cysteine peptidase n=1 Tax=Dysgonomonas sp. Marseille-P4677 TaxID=2364790 RepID=UPI0019112AF6|nr:clostripain-related cysteine peptidase [Dysgonomonas sp. Marseille-P4677]MBK5722598.1 hypothetical protein [Dysgonomonas sp. Marseille-P4677]